VMYARTERDTTAWVRRGQTSPEVIARGDVGAPLAC